MDAQAKRDAAQRKLTKEFLATIQTDIDYIRQLSEEEYGQALDTISEVSSRMNVKEPVVQRPSSLGGVRQ